MKNVNVLIDYCNWDIVEMSSKCVYAVGTESFDERIFVITEVYNDITGVSFHVGIIQHYKDDIVENQIKSFNSFAEAKALLDAMTYSDFDVYVNECEV